MSNNVASACHIPKCEKSRFWRPLNMLVLAGSLSALLFGAHLGVEKFSRESELFNLFRNLSIERVYELWYGGDPQINIYEESTQEELVSNSGGKAIESVIEDIKISEAFILFIELISPLLFWLSVMLALIFTLLSAVMLSLRYFKVRLNDAVAGEDGEG